MTQPTASDSTRVTAFVCAFLLLAAGLRALGRWLDPR